jgi:hypothetical protein
MKEIVGCIFPFMYLYTYVILKSIKITLEPYYFFEKNVVYCISKMRPVPVLLGVKSITNTNKVLKYETFSWFDTSHSRCPSIGPYVACLCSSPNPFGISIPNM